MLILTQSVDISKIFKEKLREYLNKCYQCASCSGVCQIGRVQKYTPSKIIQLIIEGFEDQIVESGILWDCLTCNSCLQMCPHEVNFAEIVRDARNKMLAMGIKPQIAHKGFYTSISEILSKEYIFPERNLDWVPSECEIAGQGEILYFVGCAPFFDYEFPDSNNNAVDTLKILSKIEDKPIVLLKNEKCCGHDLLWQGKIETFKKLAIQNIESFKKSGVSLIITSCAEGYRTLKIDYPSIFKDFNIEVKHLVEYIYEKLLENKITFKKVKDNDKNINLTYHDPCRLSRFLPSSFQIYEKIRYIFKELEKAGYNFKEMAHNKANSLCCGVSCWLNCTDKTKALRHHRMIEAKDVADTLITTCPKCKIHLKCLQDDTESVQDVKILDFSNLVVNLIDLNEIEPSKQNKKVLEK